MLLGWKTQPTLKSLSFSFAKCLLLMTMIVCLPSGIVRGQSKTLSSADLVLTTEQGPWLILAMTFEGENAKKQAVQLAAELRRDYQMNAYCLVKKFDYTQSVVGAGITEQGTERRMKYQNNRLVESCAVLVGNFDDIDSMEINDTLTKLKSIQPKFFNRDNPKADTKKTKPVVEDNKKGPMKAAFKTRNPLLPAEYYKSPEVDKFVRKLNQEKPFDEYNLLECQGKFSVRVLTLRGEDSYVSWGRSTTTETSEEKASKLELAAEQVHMVTKALRIAGYEAYQFHDRQQSIVTVGSFNNLGTTDAKGQFVYDPAILNVVSRFAGTNSTTVSDFGKSQTPRLLFELVDQKSLPELTQVTPEERLKNFRKLAVPFDLIPTPMAAPKIEATLLYSKHMLGK